MPVLFKKVNIDISGVEKVPLNFKLRVDCPDCNTECVHDFKARPLQFPEEKKYTPVDFSCPACNTQFKVAAQVKNIRLVLAYDKTIVRKRS
jgi:hypothetical protein